MISDGMDRRDTQILMVNPLSDNGLSDDDDDDDDDDDASDDKDGSVDDALTGVKSGTVGLRCLEAADADNTPVASTRRQSIVGFCLLGAGHSDKRIILLILRFLDIRVADSISSSNRKRKGIEEKAESSMSKTGYDNYVRSKDLDEFSVSSVVTGPIVYLENSPLDKANLKIISGLKDPQLEASQRALLVKPGDSSDLEEQT
uniref:Uncharacterized protein n=1 Tax=Vespula pensylvanica TaxID=30213 RepID=A0A834UFK1_VESPE|nr:hypothetical protein H0235_003782 [Vespula pensylvanica]